MQKKQNSAQLFHLQNPTEIKTKRIIWISLSSCARSAFVVVYNMLRSNSFLLLKLSVYSVNTLYRKSAWCVLWDYHARLLIETKRYIHTHIYLTLENEKKCYSLTVFIPCFALLIHFDRFVMLALFIGRLLWVFRSMWSLCR